MLNLLTILIAINSILLILVVLIQNPKGGGIDSSIGGLGATQMLGVARSTDFIEKLTWYLAISLLVLCIITALLVSPSTEGTTPLLSE